MNSVNEDIARIGRIAAIPAILDAVGHGTGMGCAAIVRVGSDRWTPCAVLHGAGFGIAIGTDFDLGAMQGDERTGRVPIAIGDAGADPDAGLRTPRVAGLGSFLAAPVELRDRSHFGLLCAIDARPARFDSPVAAGAMRLLAELVALHLDAGDALPAIRPAPATAPAEPADAAPSLSMIGHDFRNLLAALDSGISLLLREPQSERGTRVIGLMKASLGRLTTLAGTVLDRARAAQSE